jgi:hypothetical protein
VVEVSQIVILYFATQVSSRLSCRFRDVHGLNPRLDETWGSAQLHCLDTLQQAQAPKARMAFAADHQVVKSCIDGKASPHSFNAAGPSVMLARRWRLWVKRYRSHSATLRAKSAVIRKLT